jgi:hypothetical protein
MKNTSVSLILTAASMAAGASLTFAGPAAPAKETVVPVLREDIPVHPITAPYWNEDTTITTDARPVFAYHKFPGEILGGGRALVSALQLRIKLTDSLQLVAYKDGWMNFQTPGLRSDGWNDLAAGLKWAFYRNDSQQLRAAVGAGYEFATGDDQVLQDDDEVRLWLSVDKGFRNLHLGVVVNYLHSMGNGDDILGNSNTLSWHFHADYQVCKFFSPVFEINGYHVVDNDTGNDGIVTPFGGADVANLGGNSRESVVTAGLGVEVRPHSRLALRAAYELPLTDNTDVFGHRWTFSAVIKF